MLRTVRASRSLPSLRSAAMAQSAVPAMPTMPVEMQTYRTMATTTKPLRTRKSTAALKTEMPNSMVEPKKRGRPRKNTLTPTTHKRSNSTDTKTSEPRRSKKSDPVPTIPQPPASEAPQKPKSSGSKASKQPSNVPTPADSYHSSKPEAEARDAHSTISTSNPEDLGTRVQAISRKNASEAEKFAQQAVSALESTGESISRVQDLLQETLQKADAGADAKQDKYKYKPEEKEIPQGEKTVLLSMLGLTGLWVAFGGKLQRKKNKQ